MKWANLELFKIVESGAFTPKQIYDCGKPSTDPPMQTPNHVIYIIVYRDNFYWAWYNGKTIQFSIRFSQHRKEIEGTHELKYARGHYTIAREHKEWRMIPIIQYAANTPNIK